MYAMQYAITLPTDYDMQIIRNRVATTGHRMDGFPGLEFKAYLIQERAKGAPRNAYAPFYLWRDIDGMRSFCWGEPGYSAIVRDFGRHPIQDWTVAGLTTSRADLTAARSLTMTSLDLPTRAAPSECLGEITGPFLSQGEESSIARVAAVDVTTWRVILVELSTAQPDQEAADPTGYEVLHVSMAA